MALTVEDGIGLPDADAFVTVEACTSYCAAHGLTDWTAAPQPSPDADEAAIRRATSWLSTNFTWKGVRVRGRGQGQAFPRTDVVDAEGFPVAADEVPSEIVKACCIAAAFERANPGGLTPAVTLTDRVKREQVGALQVEYFANPMSAEAAKPLLTRVQALISGLLDTSTNALVGTAVRR